jgi:tRNA-dependent cyclodipeptide synthase
MTTDFDYSVRVKNGAGWRDFDRVRLVISVGQPYHEGKKLQAVVDWINRNSEIRKVHVSVNDLLQRHNFVAAGMTEQRASAIALAAGTQWIERNAIILSGIKAGTTITRWEDWFPGPAFTRTNAALLAYADHDILFDEAISKDASDHAERKMQRGEPIANLDRVVAHNRDYITEELSVFANQSRQLPAAEVYPGSNLTSAHYLIGKKLPEPLDPLASRYFARIDFAHINVAATASPSPSLRLEFK